MNDLAFATPPIFAAAFPASAPNSNIAQRTAHLLILVWLGNMVREAAPTVAALRRQYPVVARWLSARARNLESSSDNGKASHVRFQQARLWAASMYTDDSHFALLGPQRIVRVSRLGEFSLAALEARRTFDDD
ncbi:MAG: hypothetical protein SGPRY_001480 [Prymnesium sp.]